MTYKRNSSLYFLKIKLFDVSKVGTKYNFCIKGNAYYFLMYYSNVFTVLIIIGIPLKYLHILLFFFIIFQADDSLEQSFDGHQLTNHNNLPTVFDTFDGVNPFINNEGLSYNNSRESSEGLTYDRGFEAGIGGLGLVESVEMRQKKERPTPPSRSSSLFKVNFSFLGKCLLKGLIEYVPILR